MRRLLLQPSGKGPSERERERERQRDRAVSLPVPRRGRPLTGCPHRILFASLPACIRLPPPLGQPLPAALQPRCTFRSSPLSQSVTCKRPYDQPQRERKREEERDTQSPAGYTQEGDYPPHLPLSGSAVRGRKRPYSPSLSVSRSLSHTHTPPWEDKSYQAFFLAAVPSGCIGVARALSLSSGELSVSLLTLACLACLSLSPSLSPSLNLPYTPHVRGKKRCTGAG